MRRIALALVAIFALTGVAQAQTQTFSFDITEQDIPFSESFTLPGFDPALGTLTGVEIISDVTLNASVDVINVTDDDEAVTAATASVPFEVTGPAGLDIDQTLSVGPFDGTAVANSTTTLGSGSTTESASATFTDAADLAMYTTDSTLDFEFSGSAATFGGVGTPGATFFGGSASALGTVTVVYTFIPIPEPSSLVLVGLGGVALLAGRKVLRRA